MTKEIKVCDICQSEISNKEYADMIANEEVVIIELITGDGSKSMDLCSKCSDKLTRYIYNM